MFNVKKFIDRKHWTLEDLANRLFEKGGTSRVGNWSAGTSSPRYGAILKLIELGITAEELLGKDHADLLIKNSLDGATTKTLFGVEYAATHQLTPEPAENREPIDYQDPKFLAALEKGMKLIEERKKQGIK